jgi:hypothetical protein
MYQKDAIMIPSSSGPSIQQLQWFYKNQMMPRGTRGEQPAFNELDKGLVADIREEYQNGNLTGNELSQMTNKVGEQDARAFLSRLASNPASRDLKQQLAAEGISLTDESDVGPGKRFETVEDKANYIVQKYTYTVRTIIPNIIAFGWGFVDPTDATLQDQARDNNTPAGRGALQVNTPKSSGGTASVSQNVEEPQKDGKWLTEAFERIMNLRMIRVF